jgi:hypothetical protein
MDLQGLELIYPASTGIHVNMGDMKRFADF